MLAGLMAVFFAIHLLTLSQTGIHISDNQLIAYNSAYLIFRTELVLGLFGLLPAIVFVVTAATRDQALGTADFFYTRPISKGAYLLGRFAGGALCALLVGLAGVAGDIAGTFLPSLDPDRLAAFDWRTYALVFTTLVAPNLLVFCAFAFSVAVIGRNALLSFAMALVFMVLGLIVNNPALSEGRPWLALLDPFGGVPVEQLTHYSTVAELNSVAPVALLPTNRLLWLILAALALTVATWTFRLQHPLSRPSRNRNPSPPKPPPRRPGAAQLARPLRPRRRPGAVRIAMAHGRPRGPDQPPVLAGRGPDRGQHPQRDRRPRLGPDGPAPASDDQPDARLHALRHAAVRPGGDRLLLRHPDPPRTRAWAARGHRRGALSGLVAAGLQDPRPHRRPDAAAALDGADLHRLAARPRPVPARPAGLSAGRLRLQRLLFLHAGGAGLRAADPDARQVERDAAGHGGLRRPAQPRARRFRAPALRFPHSLCRLFRHERLRPFPDPDLVADRLLGRLLRAAADRRPFAGAARRTRRSGHARKRSGGPLHSPGARRRGLDAGRVPDRRRLDFLQHQPPQRLSDRPLAPGTEGRLRTALRRLQDRAHAGDDQACPDPRPLPARAAPSLGGAPGPAQHHAHAPEGDIRQRRPAADGRNPGGRGRRACRSRIVDRGSSGSPSLRPWRRARRRR